MQMNCITYFNQKNNNKIWKFSTTADSNKGWTFFIFLALCCWTSSAHPGARAQNFTGTTHTAGWGQETVASSHKFHWEPMERNGSKRTFKTKWLLLSLPEYKTNFMHIWFETIKYFLKHFFENMHTVAVAQGSIRRGWATQELENKVRCSLNKFSTCMHI